MLDWKTTEDDKSLTPLDDTDTTLLRRRRGLWVVMILLVIAVSAGGVYLYQRVQRGNEAIQRDVLAFIRREEQARRLGQQDAAENFLPEATPPDFATAYTRLFVVPPVPSGVEVTLADFALQDNTAQVVVGLGAQRQRRAYRLTEGGWRRVPLATEWGDPSRIEKNGLTLTFYDSDTKFAQQLATDLIGLANDFEALAGGFAPQATITIEPRELANAFLETARSGDDTTAVTVNSPQVVELPAHWTVSSDAAIRYTLAQRLWSEWTVVPQQPMGLPRAERLVAASFQVRTLRWATQHDPTLYDTLITAWRTTATADGWHSPFDPATNYDPLLDPFAPTADEAAMLLVANAAYETQPTMAWADFQEQVLNREASSWDEIFVGIANETTREIETRARGDSSAAEVPAFPLTGRVTVVGASDDVTTYHMEVEGYDTPIVLEHSSEAPLTFTPPDGGTPLPLSSWCLAQFPRATVSGEWREVGLRVAATHMTVDASSFPALFHATPPPSDTVAYLGQGVPDRGASILNAVVAVGADGAATTVLTATQGVFNAYVLNGIGNPNGVFVFPGELAASCPVSVAAWYDFTKGVVGQWMFNWSSTTTTYYPVLLWDEVANQGMLFLITFDGVQQMPYWRLYPGDNRYLRNPDGTLPAGEFAAVRPGAQEVLLMADGRTVVQRISLDTGEVLARYRVRSDVYATVAAYTHDGTALMVGWMANGPQGPGDVVRYDLTTGTDSLVWSTPLHPIRNLHADQQLPLLYAMTEVEADNPLVVAVGTSAVQTVYQGQRPDRLWQEFPCRGGGLGYWLSHPTGGAVIDPLDTPQTLNIVTVEGVPRYPPISLPPDSTPLGCE